MALSWNEIKDRAIKFAKEWETASNERSESQTFWYEFFNIFGISPRRVATFEKPVKKLGNKQGFVDLFWKGTILVEHKSKGKDLEKAYEQAKEYFVGIKDEELPKYILVSDFEKFKLYNLDDNNENEFELKDLYKNIELFGFIAGYQKRTYRDTDPVNIQAAELMGKLHDKLKEIGYTGHELEMYLVRLLFCLFSDDTSIFEKDIFVEYLENKTKEDGSDLGLHLSAIFQVLNTPPEKRLKILDEHLKRFSYVNGKLFEECISIASFNTEMRSLLIQACYLDWGQISPAIFGSLFQSVMKPEERRNLGAHYTSEKNILKLIKPLFLDDLYKEFEGVKNNKNKLNIFHGKLGKLKFFDPACGCGNFLVIAYREIRLLELEVLREIYKYANKVDELMLDVSMFLKVNIDQVYGVEYEEFPARIASVAMWLIDHQMNMKISEEFGQYFARLPLKKSANIHHGNSLRMNWEEIVPKNELSYILGNPPFIGKQLQNEEQKKDMEFVFGSISNGNSTLDYVTAWYLKSSEYIKNTKVKVAFVSTNSITQGEQVGVLWNKLLNQYGVKIHFAHKTFKWSNEAKGNANVYCVIIGFANFDINDKRLFDYKTPNSEPHEIKAKNINPYLVDYENIFLSKRRKPICNVPEISFGSMPNDGGYFLFTDDEKNSFLQKEPNAEKFFKPLMSAKEFLNNEKRWCLWLVDSEPSELKKLPEVNKRVQLVKEIREKSSREETRNLSEIPLLFGEIRQPELNYILIPRVSSENRKYIPMGFFDKNYIVSDTCLFVKTDSLYYFGILQSVIHMSWVKYTCGRLESRFRYSNEIVYNNFPFPENTTEKQIKKVEEKAKKILEIRNEFTNSSLSDLYNPLSMPPKLTKAHHELDKAVDLCYSNQVFENETKRIEFLFDLYNKYNEPLLNLSKEKKKSVKIDKNKN